MRILLTGGTGFLGSALIDQLSPHKHTFISFDNLSRKSHLVSQKDKYETYIGDVRNIGDLRNAVKNQHFDALWHFAYINGTKTFYSDPDLVLDVGVRGALSTIDVALEAGIKNYVLCSTSEVYNEPSQIPTTEQERLIIPNIHNPRFSYSGGKIISEILTIHYGAKRGLHTKIFRPHNIYGPNMGLEHAIPELVKKVLFAGKDKKVYIQGNGKETRAFCYINDAVEQISIAVDDKYAENSTIYNIGANDEITIYHLTEMIAKILDIDVDICCADQNPIGGTNRRCPDMTKITNLGYQAKNSLEIGLRKTVEWYKAYYEKIV